MFGGEPLLHPDLEEICKEVASIKNILRLYIITNGTIIPSQNQIKAIKDNGFDLAMSDYGDLSIHKSKIIDLAHSNNINLSIVDIDNTWFDLGDLAKRNRLEEKNKYIFRGCINSLNPSYPLING